MRSEITNNDSDYFVEEEMGLCGLLSNPATWSLVVIPKIKQPLKC